MPSWRAVDVPVTLKIRTGVDPDHRNALTIARIAEDAGIRALAVHGRTRACAYVGPVEYDTIRAVKAAVRIPVIANGDIATPRAGEARARLHRRRRDHDRPRGAGPAVDLSRDLSLPRHRQRTCRAPTVAEARAEILRHLDDHYAFYGETPGVRIARKHLGWYTKDLAGGDAFRREMNGLEASGRTDCRSRPILRYTRRKGGAPRLSRIRRRDRGRAFDAS